MTDTLPTWGRIADHWRPSAGDLFGARVDPLECFACFCRTTLEKSHLQDRALGGSCDPENIVPLCRRCNRAMPSYLSPEKAMDWIRAQETDLERMARLLSAAQTVVGVDPVRVWETVMGDRIPYPNPFEHDETAPFHVKG